MKKSRLCPHPNSGTGLKIFLIMKLCLFLLVFFTFSLTANVRAQKEKVNLNLKDVSMKTLFEEIQRQTSFYFVFSAEQTQRLGMFTVEAKNESLEKVLDRIFANTGFVYEFNKDLIIVRPRADVAQAKREIRVVGKVTDEKKLPLPGVTVQLKGLQLGTATDKDGNYSIRFMETDKGMVLVFSFIGMETQEIKYAGKDTINVVMRETVAELDEVVINTGYTRVDARKTASAITTIKAEDIITPGLQTIDQMLEGYVPGMIFMQNTGQIGAAPRLRIRGTSTVLGSQEPLWVVDGVVVKDPVNVDPQDLNDLDFVNLLGNAISGLNPEDIEQIDVLKDASATAIYGKEAANGVIVITTKKGKQGPPTVTYSLSGSFTQRPSYNDKSVNMMNSKQRIDLSREMIEKKMAYPSNTMWVGYEAAYREYLNGRISYEEFERQVNYYETLNTDWFDILFRNAFSHNHNVGISGGTEQATYHASFGYSETKNTAIGNDQVQYTGNVSISANLWKSVSLSTNLSGSVGKTKGFVGTDPFGYASKMNRAIPAYNEDGSRFFYKSADNGYLFNVENELEHSGTENTVSTLNASVNLRWRITDDISFNTSVSYSTSETNGSSWYSERTNYIAQKRGYDYGAFEAGSKEFEESKLPNGGEYNSSHNSATSWNWRNSLDWIKVLNGVHSFSVMLGQEMSSSQNNGYKLQSYGYIPDKGKIFVNLPAYTQHNAVDPPVNDMYRTTPTLTESESNTLSYYLTLSYMYDNRYAFNASVRGDGSNRFGQDKKERFLPVWACGFRWNLGYEPWLQGQNILSDMSVRVSYGYQGNVAENVSPDLIATIVEDKENYDYKLVLKDLPAPDLKWEKTSNLNIGVDWSFFSNKISGSFEWYWKKTTDLVTELKVPYEHGVDSRPVNGGEMTNTGWDASVGFTPVRTKNFVLSMGLTFSGVNNKLKSEIEPNKTWKEATTGNLNKDGYPVTSFWAFKFTGLNPEHGGPEFDIEGMETEEGLKDATVYMAYAGKMEPDFTTGLSLSIRYKTFSLSSGLYLSLGNQQFMAPPMESFSSIPSEYENMSTEWLDRWRKPGDEKYTNVPSLPDKRTNALKWQAPDTDQMYPYQMYAYSDVRVVDAWYIRCGSISCSYTMPEKLLPNGLQNMSFSFSLSNPFQIRSKDFKGRDPEVALGGQPLQRAISLGVSVSF